MWMDHTNADSIAKAQRHVHTTLLRLRDNLRRDPSADELAVRLCAGSAGELWFATGDVQFYTVHGAACSATTLTAGLDDDAITEEARRLVDDVAEQLALSTTEDE